MMSITHRTPNSWLRLTAVWALALAPAAIVMAAPQPTGADEAAQFKVAEQLSAAYERVAQIVTPSVVSIETSRTLAKPAMRRMSPNMMNPQSPEDFMRRFFGMPTQPERPNDDRNTGRPEWRAPTQIGEGSGFILDKSGHIITNNHVVENADQIRVRLWNGEMRDAEVVGVDPLTDVAVLKIDSGQLQPIALASSSDQRVGELVVAVGTPFGLTSSITTGVISAMNRTNMGLASYEDFLQTDASINPGNSGGPLVNLRGEVIGMNTAIVGAARQSAGVGFAIPVDVVQMVATKLIEQGEVTRGWLGVVIQPLSSALANSFAYDGEGVLVGDVTDDGPAKDAGIKAGDIIVQFNGDPVSDANTLRFAVAKEEPGVRVPVVVFRNGSKRTIRVTLGELPTPQTAGAGATRHNNHESRGAFAHEESLGMSVRTLTPSLAEQFKIDPKQAGVIVTAINPLGIAAGAGLRPGDVIIRVQGRDTDDVAQLERALDKSDLHKGVRLTVMTGGLRRFVFVQTDKD